MALLQIKILPGEVLASEEEFGTVQEAHDAAQAMVDKGKYYLGEFEHNHELETWTNTLSKLKLQIVEG